MLDKIKALLQEVENMKAANAEELEALRIKYLSKKGEISALLRPVSTLIIPLPGVEFSGKLAGLTMKGFESRQS